METSSMLRLEMIAVIGMTLLCLHFQAVACEEICSTENNIIKFCDGEKSYCCFDGTACCLYWYTDIKVIVIGFLCLCAGALIIPITCTVCAYCIFNVILGDRTKSSDAKDAEAIGQEESVPDRKFPIGHQSDKYIPGHQSEKYAPEVFISPEEFILDLQSKNSDKKCLINET